MAEITVFYEGPIVTRAEARMAGQRRFFTGKPCLRGHIAERFLPSGNCAQCTKETKATSDEREKQAARSLARYWANPDRARAEAMRSYERHREARIEAMRRRYATDPQKDLIRTRGWRQRNPDRARALRSAGKARRRAIEKAAPGTVSAGEILELFLRQRGRCTLCGGRLPKRGYHADHRIPLALGGRNDKSNIELTHAKCNLRKQAKDPLVFARELGRLL